MHVVIAGGGISGLWLALRLLEDDEELDVTILEAHDKLGGRIRTAYDSAGLPVLETGAWRLPDKHYRMMSLCKELGLELQEVESENNSTAGTAWFECARAPVCHTENDAAASEIKYGISTWDALAANNGVPCAQESAARTGYAGADAMASGTNAYDVESLFKRNDAAENTQTYWVPKLGLSSICDTLASRIRKYPKRARIQLQSRLSRVQTLDESDRGMRFHATAVIRDGKNSHSLQTFQCHALVLAIPPEQAKNIAGVQSLISPVLETLQGVPLFKAFCAFDEPLRSALGLQSRPFHVKANNLCQQLISNTYAGHDIIQIAYCSGQRADSLEHFRLCGKGRRVIADDIARIAQGDQQASDSIRALLLRRRMRFYYWKNAVHIWLPTVVSLDIAEKSREACVLPSARLPGVFLCGEAYSTVQGWSEGALESAEHVRYAMRLLRNTMQVSTQQLAKRIAASANLKLTFASRIPRGCIVLFGRIVDVTHWKKVHPGSKAAIENHEGEDVSCLFLGALHPSYALGIAFALQIGWCERSLHQSIL